MLRREGWIVNGCFFIVDWCLFIVNLVIMVRLLGECLDLGGIEDFWERVVDGGVVVFFGEVSFGEVSFGEVV